MVNMSMEPPGLVYITKSAVRVIEEEARRQSEGGQFKHETGGILIGRRLTPPNHRELLVVAATRPGVAALHRPDEFKPDVDYVNQHLREYLAIYPKMDYIGVWHQHPPEYPTFSEGDVLSAQALCSDDDYRAGEVVNPIVWIRDNTFTIRYYYMNRGMATRQLPFVQIDRASLCLIDDEHPLVQAEKNRPAGIPIPSQRLQEERQRLTSQGYSVQIGAENRYTYFRIQKSDRPDLAIYAITSPSYPKDMPVLAVEQSGHKVEFDDTALWAAVSADGTPYLVDLASTLAAQLPAPPERITGRLTPTNDSDSKRITGRLAIVNDSGAQQTSQSIGIRRFIGWSRRIAPLVLALIGIVVVVASATIAWQWDAQGSADLPTIVALSPTAAGSATSKTAAITLSTSSTPQSDLVLKWQNVQAASLAQQIDLIEQLRQAGIQRDPSGTPTAERLLTARMKYAAELAAQGDYNQAITIAQKALNEAPAGSKQQVANQLADMYLSAGDSALERRDFANAILYYPEIEKITPKPSGDRIAQAATKLEDTKRGSEERIALQQDWQDYDKATLTNKIIIIEKRIIPIIGWTPEPTKYPAEFYDKRTLTIADEWGQTYLQFARSLQIKGDLDSANSAYVKVQQSQYVSLSAVDIAKAGIKNVESARQAWNTVNRSSSTQDRIAALIRLQNLPGFGPNAQRPVNGPTVAALLVQPTRTPEPTPTEPLILIPTVEQPTEQPNPAPTEIAPAGPPPEPAAQPTAAP